MGLEKLSKEEQDLLLKLMEKVDAPDDPPVPKAGDMIWDEANQRWTIMANPGPPNIQRTLDATEWTKREIANMEAVGESNYRTGIKNPRKSPKEAALKGHDKYKAKMKKDEVLERQKTERAKVSDEEFLALCETVGAGRLVEGFKAHAFKIRNFNDKWVPLIRSHLAAIDAMPDATDAEREAKMLANRRGLIALKGKAK